MLLFRANKMALLILMMGVLAGCSQEPDDVVKDYFTAIAKGDEEKAMSFVSLMRAETQNIPYAKSNLQRRIRETKQLIDSNGGLKKIEFRKVEIKEDKYASVAYTLIFKNGRDYQDGFAMGKSGTSGATDTWNLYVLFPNELNPR